MGIFDDFIFIFMVNNEWTSFIKKFWVLGEDKHQLSPDLRMIFEFFFQIGFA